MTKVRMGMRMGNHACRLRTPLVAGRDGVEPRGYRGERSTPPPHPVQARPCCRRGGSGEDACVHEDPVPSRAFADLRGRLFSAALETLQGVPVWTQVSNEPLVGNGEGFRVMRGGQEVPWSRSPS